MSLLLLRRLKHGPGPARYGPAGHGPAGHGPAGYGPARLWTGQQLRWACLLHTHFCILHDVLQYCVPASSIVLLVSSLSMAMHVLPWLALLPDDALALYGVHVLDIKT